ncbi:MAG: phenylacetate--CoA ligase family protein, partial [Thermodesulfobacteriota bacterium]|nr:phenylacetate--CoA ligase family protein [Thermodesulfobacteriota bacterium]
NQATRPPFGDLLAVRHEDLSRIYIAPGPLALPFIKDEYDALTGMVAKGFYICGARESDIVNVAASYHWVIAGTALDEAFRKIGCAVLPGGPGMSKMHIEMMRLTKTTVLMGFTMFVSQLGETAKEMGIDPSRDLSLRLLIVLGDVRAEDTKGKMERTFGAEVREAYGTADLGLIAAECPEGGGMHLYEEVLVEVIDPNTGKHVQHGEGGEIVASDIVRKAMPIIRYRTGDITEGLNLEPCPCGRTTPRLKRILGRVSDIPKVKGMFVNPSEVQGVLKRHPELGRFQIIVDRPKLLDELTIQVECNQPVEKEKVSEVLVRELKEVIRLKSNVVLVEQGSIPGDAGVLDDRRKI